MSIGYISIDQLSDSLKEYLTNLGLSETEIVELIKEITGDLSGLSTTEKGSIVGAINELFQSANNGKSTIATAIGSPLASTDTFAAMGTKINAIKNTLATNITAKGVSATSSETMTSLANKVKNITSAKDIKVDGVAIGSNFELVSAGNSWFNFYKDSTLPYSSYGSCVVVYNNEIHILGGESPNQRNHYKFNGKSWVRVSSLPYPFSQGLALVYNNEIHIMGAGTSYPNSHYKWNGSSWSNVSTIPVNTAVSKAIVYNNKIHLFSSYDNGTGTSVHYEWDGSSWTTSTNMPYSALRFSLVVYNNAIHLLGGDYWSSSSTTRSYYKLHYKYDGSSWTKLTDIPYEFSGGAAVIQNDEIHILGGGGTSGTTNNHYKWNGSSWSSVSTTPHKFVSTVFTYNNEIHSIGGTDVDYSNNGCKHMIYRNNKWCSFNCLPYEFYYSRAVLFKNEIHILGGSRDGTYKKHYKWNGSEWEYVSTLPYDFLRGSIVVFDNAIHVLGSVNSGDATKHYKWNGSTWTSVSTIPYQFYDGCALVYNNQLHILGGYKTKKYHYRLNGTSWTSVSTIGCELYAGGAVVYNNEIHVLGGSGGSNPHYKYNGSTWTAIGSIPSRALGSAFVVFDNKIYILGGNADPYYNYNMVFDGFGWYYDIALPIDFTYGDAVVYNDSICIFGSGVEAHTLSTYTYKQTYDINK